MGMAKGTTPQRQRVALQRMAEETAFTVLHRLAALRMAEERGVLPLRCIGDGLRSDGFRLFQQFSGGRLGRDEEAYRVFLERVFDEIAQDLPSLFDRREPRSLVFPRPDCLEEVVTALTADELRRAWQDDEAIGWVYQDFHPAKERRELRRGRDVPADSRELAIRNQLFTPRWVVEFLADNTLGRLWIEMTEGKSAIGDACRFLFRTDETAPVGAKDPRDIRVLDPACGSGHFLLYAFDLLEHIYLEAWELKAGTSPGRTPVWVEYEDKGDLRREVPRLILRHNLFGVDIDALPIQVAALALWLRAQRSWREIPFADRPRIKRMNLVCAEQMPGDRTQIEAFAADLGPPVLGDLVRQVWQEMRSVGETGLLLRIDQRIREIIRDARDRWENGTAGPVQTGLFDETPNWPGRRHDLSDLAEDEAARFWSSAEGLVVQALADYAAQAGTDERVLRRLFAEDAERGFAFIDLSRIRYDVVLMNPPFGEPAEETKNALDMAYPKCGHEIYAMFFQRSLELVEAQGRVGAITNRTWLALKQLRGLREKVFVRKGAVTLGADLGSFVLEAQVETCAVIVSRLAGRDTPATWVRLMKTRRKDGVLRAALQAVSRGIDHPYVYVSSAGRYMQLPLGVYAYWLSDDLLNRFVTSPSLEIAVGESVVGTQATPDSRFLRLVWEVSPDQTGLDRKWPRFAKGGEYRPFWDDIHMVLNWENDGSEVKALARGRPQNTQYFGRRGVTWPNRTTSPFGPRVLPQGCAFGHKGPAVFSRQLNEGILLGFLSSRPTRLMLSVRLGAADEKPGSAAKAYEVGVVNLLPWSEPKPREAARLGELATRAAALARKEQVEGDSTGEACSAWGIPSFLQNGRSIPLTGAARLRVEAREDRFGELARISDEIDRLVAGFFAFTDRDLKLMDDQLEASCARYAEPESDPPKELFRMAYLTKSPLPGDQNPGGLDAEVDIRVEHRRGRQTKALRDEETLCRLFELPPQRLAAIRRRLGLLRDEDMRRCAADVVSWAVGLVFGRWDVRLLDHPDWIPRWPDPFGPLPRCPLGQLVDASGLPATPGHVASEAWLAARTDATKLPRVEKDAEGTPWLLDDEGHRTEPAETDDGPIPIPIVWDGVLQDDSLDDAAPSRHLDDLYRRVSQVLELIYGEALAEREAELAQALGVDSLVEWLRDPQRFFADHLARYSKSRRRAPIYWPLCTASGGFTLWLYYPRISKEMLSGCVNRLRESDEALRRDEARLLAARRAGSMEAGDQDRLDRLAVELREREALREALNSLVNRGLEPHLDDGAVVNAAPLARWFRHRTWREAAEKIWAEVREGEHDWSHLALWLRRDEVPARCRSERDLAIAHGREDLYVPPPESGTRRGRTEKPSQLEIPGPPGGD
jgi:hypothetical protein